MTDVGSWWGVWFGRGVAFVLTGSVVISQVVGNVRGADALALRAGGDGRALELIVNHITWRASVSAPRGVDPLPSAIPPRRRRAAAAATSTASSPAENSAAAARSPCLSLVT